MDVIHSIEPKTEVLQRFGPFRYCTKVDANWPNWCHECTSSLNNVASEFFAMNAADPLHWTKNSCFEAFRTILILQKVDAKLAELVPLSQKFAKQSRVGIFVAFQTVSLLHETRCKTGRTCAIIAQVR
jgi:hypothetical protein